jgi:hypothetical protein
MHDGGMRRIVIAAGFLACTLPATAQDNPPGIAFAQAEEGTFWCRDASHDDAVLCALKKCEAGAGGQACHITRWCMPAGWTGMMVAWLPEFHTTHVACGLPGRDAAEAVLKAICDTSEDFSQCDVVRFIDPDGVEEEVTDLGWPGPAHREPSE